MPEISVVVTSYNIERYIDDCLADIAAQTLPDLEIIVVDDGSRDGTPDIIRDWAARDARIRPVLLEENSVGGVATAANAGIDLATGRYIGFADGDDRYDPTMFARLLEAAVSADADLAICSYFNLDTETGETGLPSDAARWAEIASEGVLELDTAGRRRLLALNAVPWRKIYSARFLNDHDIRFPVGPFFYEDNPFHWFTTLSANRAALVDARLCRHRVGRIGQTTSAVDARLLRMFAHHAIIKRWIEETGQDAEFRSDLLVWAARQLSWIGRKCPDDLRTNLFAAIDGVVALHEADEIDDPDMRRRIGRRTAELLASAKSGDFESFCAGLDESVARTPKRRAGAAARFLNRFRGRA
ncbi:glycosyltransferase [Tropicimonas sp. IMCC6043]|uniref:glycosyltransferase family 2 protein n=1 Tax=Tropicimonas sp. IMCC6043 TaxID=2510645 RepID=UPI00101DB1EF|nr:glycosyltransferase [Tropicimonas sp. IMCC6043]RYH10979.1 glycosyltransferase [Tropicimonas sp. IMCC6043]